MVNKSSVDEGKHDKNLPKFFDIGDPVTFEDFSMNL